MGANSRSKNRSVERLLYASIVDMGGLPVRQPIPTKQVEQIDPFILLHHGEIKIPEHREPKTLGVGPHPHRGFSPVTFIFKGAVHHRDSRGNSSVVTEGGTQWMNAGMGIIHSERPPENIHEIGSSQEIIQLWINTPASKKMDQPSYHALQQDQTPQVSTEDENIEIRVVAGQYDGIKGPIPSLSPVLAIRAKFKKGGSHYFSLPESYNAFIYALNGKLRIEGYGFMDGLNLAQLNSDGEGIEIFALEDSRFILMAGEPLNEPMVQHGPFVMNTTTQVMEAMRDYQMGKMGVLIEEDLE